MLKEKLIQKFGSRINHMSCVYLNDGENVLRYFLGKLQNKRTAIEIGTYQGVAASIISEHFDSVYTLDIKSMPLRIDIFSFLNLKNVLFQLVKNREDEIKLVKRIFKSDDVDFAFIDGEHFNGELERDFDMVKDCKNILIHDYSPKFHEVKDFCDNLKGWEKEIKGTFCFLTKKELRRRKKKAVFE